MNWSNRYFAGCACAKVVVVCATAGADEGALELLRKPFHFGPPRDAEMAPVSFEGGMGLDDAGAKPWERGASGKTESLFSFDYLKLIGGDVKATFVAPASWGRSEWLAFSGVAGGLAGLTFLDDEIREAVQDNRSATLDDISRAIQPLGAHYSFGILGAFYLGGEFLKDDRAKATALDGLSASLISGLIITEPLKRVIGRTRPSRGESDDFEPFGSNNSMPSGHATQAFTIAAVVSEHYESVWVRAIAYGAAGMIGFARMEQDAHWASDVAVGAVIGTFVGHVVAQYNQEHRNVRIEPVVGPGVQAVQLSIAF